MSDSFFEKGLNREDFLALEQSVHDTPLVYLDNAATTLKPKKVVEAISKHYQYETSNVHRGIHFLSAQATQKFELARSKVKTYINAHNEKEVIFTKGTTEAINLVATSWGSECLKKGDEIIVSTMEHHSNIVPWQLIAEKQGAKVVELPIHDNGELDLEAYQSLLNSKTKMVALTHISNTLGTVNPIKKLAKMAHDTGAFFLVDAAQSVAHMKVDVQELGVDFIAFSAHKMFGPTGVGVLWAKEAILEKMPPYQGGGAMIKEVSFSGTTFNELPEKFEAGTPHISGVCSLVETLDYIQAIGLDNIAKQEDALLEYGTKCLSEISGLSIIGRAKDKCSVISFVMQGAHPHDLGMILDEQAVAIRTGHHCTQPLMKRFNVPATARASFSFYNNKSDIDRLVAGLLKAKELL